MIMAQRTKIEEIDVQTIKLSLITVVQLIY